jgi:hypothetical protein
MYDNAADYGGENDDICVVYELRDSVTMGEYLRLRQMIFESNRLPADILKLTQKESEAITAIQEAINQSALSILGTPPIVRGVGIVKRYEAEGRIKSAGLNPIHIAKIRAERAALRLRFDLDLVFGGNDETWQETELIDIQAEAVEDETAHKDSEGSKQYPREKAEQQALKELGFG